MNVHRLSRRLERLEEHRKSKADAAQVAKEAILAELEDIRETVRRNLPRHRDPEAFHVEKSDITGRLTEVIEALRTGRPLRVTAKAER